VEFNNQEKLVVAMPPVLDCTANGFFKASLLSSSLGSSSSALRIVLS